MDGVTTGDDDTRHRRVREIRDEGWDLFLRVLNDGSIVLQAVAVSHPEALLHKLTHQVSGFRT